jgi:hypothetical protein
MIKIYEKKEKEIVIYKDLDILPIMDRLKILQKFKEINRESQKSDEEKQEKEIFLNKKIHKIMMENNFLNIGFCTDGKITDEYELKEQYS